MLSENTQLKTLLESLQKNNARYVNENNSLTAQNVNYQHEIDKLNEKMYIS